MTFLMLIFWISITQVFFDSLYFAIPGIRIVVFSAICERKTRRRKRQEDIGFMRQEAKSLTVRRKRSTEESESEEDLEARYYGNLIRY